MAPIIHVPLLAATALTALLAWGLVYRLFFHPLAKIPGPVLPALTGCYECFFDVWRPGRYPWKIKQLHEKYGPIIRPVPDEVHINDVDFLETIYGPRARNKAPNSGLLLDQSIGMSEDYNLHKTRREALNPYFTPKAVISMESLLTEKSDQVATIFEHARQSGEVLNLSNVYYGFSNDCVRNFCFGTDAGLLHDLAEAGEQRNNLTSLLSGVKVNRHFPFIPRVLGAVLPKLFGKRGLPPAIRDLLGFKANVGGLIQEVLADTHNEKKGRHSVFYELKDSPILPSREKSVQRLQDEATLLVMAGTGSTTESLRYASFYLIYYPNILAKLRAELDSAREKSKDGTISLSTLMSRPSGLAIACMTIAQSSA